MLFLCLLKNIVSYFYLLPCWLLNFETFVEPDNIIICAKSTMKGKKLQKKQQYVCVLCSIQLLKPTRHY